VVRLCLPGGGTMPFTIRRLRWYIGGLLFLSTVVNYVDRQTLSVLAPYLKTEYTWTNTDFALIVIAFRIAYSIGQTVAGTWLDRVGTRQGLSAAVLWYSAASMLTASAVGLKSFAACRFLLGAGEAANWPGATKAVSEWFPRRESGWAVALFDSGSSVGAAVAPLLVLWLFHTFGTWRPVFVITGAFGLIWLLLWRWLYHPPEVHPWISAEERAYILADRPSLDADAGAAAAPVSPRRLLGLRQTWGIILGKTLTDPVWFFITDWFAIYLVAKGFTLESSLLAFWIPFMAADAGNFLGGGISSWLINRGLGVGTARKIVIVVGGLGMSSLMIALGLNDLGPLVACFAVSTCAYAALSTMVLNLPADLYHPRAVATVSGFSGTGAGLGTIAATLAIGVVTDHYSFAPVLVVASLAPLLAIVAVLTLVRNTSASGDDLLRRV
jgi:MFS transporter, ACS family, aldohexuronate transporter